MLFHENVQIVHRALLRSAETAFEESKEIEESNLFRSPLFIRNSFEIHLQILISLNRSFEHTHSKFAGIDQTLRRVGTSDSEVGRPR